MDNLRLMTKAKKQFRRRVPRSVNLVSVTLVPEANVAPIVQPSRVTRQQTKKIEIEMKRNPIRKTRMTSRTLVEVSPTTTDNPQLNSIDLFHSNIHSTPSKSSMKSSPTYKSHYFKESRTVGTSNSHRKSQSEFKSKSVLSSRLSSKPFPYKNAHTRSFYKKNFSTRNYNRSGTYEERIRKGRYRTRNRSKSIKSNKNDCKHQQKDNISLVSKQNKTEITKVKDFEEIKLSEDIKVSKLPVGFRRCKVRYFGYKKGSFFKPKLYYICAEKTVIKSQNVEKNVVVPDFITELDPISEEENVPDFITDLDPISEEENVVPDFITELESISEEEYDMETEVATEDKNQVTPRAAEIEPVPESEVYSDIESEEELIIEEFVSGGRAYRKCIPDNPDFYQGETLIQSDIDVYKSHLIGLGYIVEIREKNDETNALQHRCILCAADIHAENDSGEMVIAHVSSFSHMFKYLLSS